MSSPSRLKCTPSDIPNVWRVDELARAEVIFSTGHAALDAQLPGGGWPQGAMIELLQGQAGIHLWELLLPSLIAACTRQAGPVVLVGAPYEPFGASLGARGLAGERLLCIRSEEPAARLWACEQSLKCAEVAAVLAWLPQARSCDLRRLQVVAHQHSRLLFVMRSLRSLQDASPAPVRLLLEGTSQMQVRILKRRGPPLETPLLLAAHPARLAALLEVRRRRGQAASPAPKAPESAGVQPIHGRRSHVLDRIAALH